MNCVASLADTNSSHTALCILFGLFTMQSVSTLKQPWSQHCILDFEICILTFDYIIIKTEQILLSPVMDICMTVYLNMTLNSLLQIFIK